MIILELNTPLPVKVLPKNDDGMAHFILDYGTEHDTLWGIFLNQSGEFWWVPTKEIRMGKNWSFNRR